MYIGHKTKYPVILYSLPDKYLLSADGDMTEANEWPLKYTDVKGFIKIRLLENLLKMCLRHTKED